MPRELSKKRVQPIVKINGKTETRWVCRTVYHCAGGQKMDRALIDVDRGSAGAEQLWNMNARIRPVEMESPCEITLNGRVIHFGIVEAESITCGEDGDTKQIVSQLQPYHFGPPITEAQFLDERATWNAATKERGKEPTYVEITEPLVFNGFLDEKRAPLVTFGGKFVGNRTANRYNAKIRNENGDATKPTKDQTHLFVPFETVILTLGRTRYANRYVYDGPSRWTVEDAIRYLCTVGNRETYVKNPPQNEYDKLPSVELPRTEIPPGKYLTELLDEILRQHGMGWKVHYVRPGERHIAFFAYGTGPECDARMVSPDPLKSEPDSFAATNVNELDASYAIDKTVNAILVLGDYVYVEGTFELYPVGDNKWVLNEAAQWEGAANAHKAFAPDGTIPIPNLQSAFALVHEEMGKRFVQRPRAFLPTITTRGKVQGATSDNEDLNPAGANDGLIIEILKFGQDDPTISETNKKWLNITKIGDASWRNMQASKIDCSLDFETGDSEKNGAETNFLIKAMANGARLRVTATIRSDWRVQTLVRRKTQKNGSGVKARENVFVWDAPDVFPCRRILTSGSFASKSFSTASGNRTMQTPSPDEIIADMKRMAETILGRSDQADVTGTVVFDSFYEQPEVGSVVKKLAGRDLNFTSSNAKDPDERWPTIVALTYDCASETITALLGDDPHSPMDLIYDG